MLGKKSWCMGKTFVITGGTSGIGLSISEMMLKHGMRVIALTNDAKQIDEATERFQQFKDHFIAKECDITSDQSRQHVKNWLASQDLDLVGLINCAGITTFGKFFETKISDLREVIRTNFEGTVLFTREIFPVILNNENTSIKYLVFLSSVTAEFPTPYFGAYPGTKAGIDVFARSLKMELPRIVKILISRPTAVNTPFYERALTTENSDIKGLMKATKGYFITPEVVAESIVSSIIKKKEGILHPGFKTKFQRFMFNLPLMGRMIRTRANKSLREKAGGN